MAEFAIPADESLWLPGILKEAGLVKSTSEAKRLVASGELSGVACVIAKEQTAFIGNDMRNDIAPARQSGFQTILFAGDARSLRMRSDDTICREIEPDLQVTHLTQLVSQLPTG